MSLFYGMWDNTQDDVVFDPDSISGLVLWLDANDGTTITEAGTGVSQWDDKSSSGLSLTQTTDANRPSLVASAYGSKSAIRFNGTSDILSTAYTATLNPSTITVIAALCVKGGAGTYRGVIGSRDGSGGLYKGYNFYTGADNDRHQIWHGGTGFWATLFDDGTYTTVSIDTPFLMSWSAGTSNDSRGWVNGNLFDTESSNRYIQNTAEPFVLGRHDNGTGNYPGDIMEVLIYNEILSDANREAIEGYLTTKWGI